MDKQNTGDIVAVFAKLGRDMAEIKQMYLELVGKMDEILRYCHKTGTLGGE